MKLLNGILRPGRITEVLEAGKVRIDAGGLFSEDDGSSSTPVLPFQTGLTNSFSMPELDQEVWVLSFTDNPRQLYWFRKDSDHAEHNEELLGETNVEVLCNRVSSGGHATIYFADGTGWMIMNGSAFLKIDDDGVITLNGSEINLDCDTINLGADASQESAQENSHPVALGDKVQEMFNSIIAVLKTMKAAAMCNIHTLPIAQAIGGKAEELDDMVFNITSSTLNVSD